MLFVRQVVIIVFCNLCSVICNFAFCDLYIETGNL